MNVRSSLEVLSVHIASEYSVDPKRDCCLLYLDFFEAVSSGFKVTNFVNAMLAKSL